VTLTEMQTLILWALLTKRGGGSFQKDIRPEVKRLDREALVRAGLITSEKRGRPGFWLETTDKGWAWAADHLDADLPKRSTAGSVVLQAWLTRIKAFLEARGLALADVFGPQPAAERGAPATLGDAGVRERIRKAYLELTGGRLNSRALLRDVREKLKDIDRGTVDAALRQMQREQEASLYQLDNQVEITDADRTAAIYFGSEPRHILWIER
jgi:hypothetical protein